MSGRPLWTALTAWGVAMVADPQRVARLVGGSDAPPAGVVRVLGARRIVQELVLILWPSPAVARAAAVVDGLHAASMLAAVRLWPRYRRAALTSAAVSTGSAAVTLLATRSPRP